MTSINAMKFDDYSGMMICDEQRHWNKDDFKIFCADKIKSIIPENVQEEQGIVAAYGNTGTSSIGEELRFAIKRRVKEEYEKEVNKLGKPPSSFKTIEEIASLAFEVITKMKNDHVDQFLQGKYNFTTKDFIRGYYTKGGAKIEIKDSDLIKDAEEAITWKSRGEDSKPIFLNGGIIAGYDPKEGFRIFQFSLIEAFYEPVSAIFAVDGSGRDMTNFVCSKFTSVKSVPERRGKIDPIEGIVTMIHAVNSASNYDLGVGGYFNIIYINGREEDKMKRMIEINDHRSKLAMQIVTALNAHLLKKDHAYKLINDLILKGGKFNDIYDEMWKYAVDRKELSRLFRGYKM